jgi:DNA-nicking Smr family endonuclease|tara:strand:- start:643 stop:1176 length:534 start_codon:yes stop_codon:yes gene_type:complete
MQDEDKNLFQEAVKNVKPLKIKSKTIEASASKPKPIAKKLIEDEKRVLLDSISDDYIYDNIESEDGLLYLRHGHSPDILNKLKKGYWVVQGSIDLHGMISQEAKSYIVDYIQECKKRHVRCIRIIHGKGIGSKNKEPVLRNKVKNWLVQKDEVIAYAQAPRYDGGSGAVIVLLKEYS